MNYRSGFVLEIKIAVVSRAQISAVQGREGDLEETVAYRVNLCVLPRRSMARLPSTLKIKRPLAFAFRHEPGVSNRHVPVPAAD